jgi:chromosome condensin MukBEF ATPase and DNA-binding subunit MukB
MVRRTTTFSHDREAYLLRTRTELEGELDRLTREEEYLGQQIRRAQDQLRYYEQMLGDLKQSFGRRAPLHEFARRLS